MTTPRPSFPVLLQDFFAQRLIAQRQASPRTVASYRDTFRLFLHYAQDRTKKPASTLTLAELDAPLILSFLDHLERERHNGARTRNARLSALRSFLHYAALQDPTTLAVIRRRLRGRKRMMPVATAMSTPCECYVCEGPIENEDELVIVSAGWEYEFQVPCHRECAGEPS